MCFSKAADDGQLERPLRHSFQPPSDARMNLKIYKFMFCSFIDSANFDKSQAREREFFHNYILDKADVIF